MKPWKSMLGFALLAAVLLGAVALQAVAQDVLPYPEPPFKGKIGRTAKESTPDFPKAIEAPKGAPNILLIMTDDVGFGASSTFGGPIPTRAMDQLAQSGLRYNMFHTTALCSPTRAALITGRNHHSDASGVIMEMATGYPGYNSLMSKSSGTMGEILKQNGYNTAWFGKNHNVPDWQSSQAGPFDLWPTSLGFEYFYGFLGGDADQWNTPLFEGTTPIQDEEQVHGTQVHGTKHLDTLLADHAIAWIQMQHSLAPDKPFLVYYTPGLAHAPHQAPQEWIAKFKGQFDQGWDKVREETLARQIRLGVVPAGTKLTPRPQQIPAWDSLSADQKKVFAHMMEVYAACLAFADYDIGRVIQAVKDAGESDNTLIIYIQGDNGASAEGTMQGTSNELGAGQGVNETIAYLLSIMDGLGGPLYYNHYPVGWAHAMDSPMQWAKQVASHFGGTRNGLVISWPKRIKDAGGLRSQFSSVIDIAPTILEATGIKEPTMINGVKQKPMEGFSMVYTFDDAKAPTHHRTQYFELVGNRGIYSDGWMASTTPLRLPWVNTGSDPSPDDFKWELYHVAEDFSQANNLAAQNPTKLKELQEIFESEAKKYNVYPLDASFAERFAGNIRPSLTSGRSTFTYFPGTIRVPEGSAPDIKNKDFTITAEVEIPEGGAEGVLATQGGRWGGWAMLLMDGKPGFDYAFSNQEQDKYRVISNDKLAPGKYTIKLDFQYDGPGIGKSGTGTLFVDGQRVAQGKIERTIPIRFSLDETFDIGEDTGTPVVEDYLSKMPFRFTGKLDKLTITLGPPKITAAEEYLIIKKMQDVENLRQ